MRSHSAACTRNLSSRDIGCPSSATEAARNAIPTLEMAKVPDAPQTLLDSEGSTPPKISRNQHEKTRTLNGTFGVTDERLIVVVH